MENQTCACKVDTVKTVFACSGAADLGEISDKIARKLQRDGARQMKCLAFIGGGIQDMIDSVKDSNMLVIDGCPLDCARLTMKKNGINDFCHLRLTDLGYTKGKTPASSQVVDEIAKHALSLS
jgi:uncharacterized metal-binding protein